MIDSRSGQPAWRTWLIGIGVLAIGAYLYLFISAILSPELPPVVGGTSVVMRTLHVQGERGSKLGTPINSCSCDRVESSSPRASNRSARRLHF